MVSVINGWLRASLAEKRALGSNFRHLLKKSRKFLLSELILLFKLVNFGR